MANEVNSAGTVGGGVDYEALVAQMRTLRQDFEALSAQAAKTVGAQARAVSHDVAQAVGDAAQAVGDTGRGAQTRVETMVRDHPMAAIGVAALAGCVLGAMFRR